MSEPPQRARRLWSAVPGAGDERGELGSAVEGETERGAPPRPSGALRRWRVPLLCVAACLVGFVLHFGAGLPGATVWSGVIVAELVIVLLDVSLGRMRPGVDESLAEVAPAPPEPVATAAPAAPAPPAPKPVEVAPPPPPPPPPPKPVAPARPRPERKAEPVEAAPAKPVEPSPQPVGAAPPRRPVRRGWPAGTSELVRCQIDWVSGYRRSRFEAFVLRPGEKRGRSIGGTEEFTWMLNAPPNPRDRAHLDAARELRATLLADGWEEVGEGAAWYSRRFVWRGDADTAPERLG